jgi:plasmid stabilization system protein ParE
VAEICFLPAAEEDYAEAPSWYQSRSSRAAAGFEAAVDVALRRIADAPEQWAFCDERHRFISFVVTPLALSIGSSRAACWLLRLPIPAGQNRFGRIVNNGAHLV